MQHCLFDAQAGRQRTWSEEQLVFGWWQRRLVLDGICRRGESFHAPESSLGKGNRARIKAQTETGAERRAGLRIWP